ncbi:hypothetical protein PSTG_17413 [Puccinia striiformis f. sp. tritici PST-78]|uniref:DUF4219 domain-containing protein n=1 Tax=Puccinia striiformis f. sp. tritici PST-78 TaxID=1165861 RepID=A0A0L0UPX0_9BASI|nr:hypothetical protein PSTG_17413 [Puccinia striiformis f. sp. tritici PST-78]
MSTDLVRDSKVVILLTPTNYAVWALVMQSKLQVIDVLSTLEGPIITKPEKEKDTFMEISEKAYHLIISYIGQEVLAFITSAYSSQTRFNGYHLWQLLRSKYAGGNIASQTTALAKWNNLAFTSISKFVPAIRSANQMINMSGAIFDDRLRINQSQPDDQHVWCHL